MNGGVNAKWLDVVVQNVMSLRHYVAEIFARAARVIQIEQTKRVRLDKAGYCPKKT